MQKCLSVSVCLALLLIDSKTTSRTDMNEVSLESYGTRECPRWGLDPLGGGGLGPHFSNFVIIRARGLKF